MTAVAPPRPARPRAGPVDRRLLSAGPVRLGLAVDVGAALVRAALLIAQATLLAHLIVEGAAGRPATELLAPLAWLAAVLAGRGLVAALVDVVGQRASSRTKRDLRHRALAPLLGADAVARPSGATATALTTGLDALDPWFRAYLPALADGLVIPPVLLLWALGLDGWSAVVLGVTLPLAPVFLALVGADARDRTDAQWVALQGLGAHLLEVVRGLPTLRLLGRADEQAGSVRAVAEDLRQRTLGVLRIAFLSALVLELIAMLGTAIVAVVIGLRLVGGGLELEPALAVLILAPEVYLPVRRIGIAFHASQEGAAAAASVLDATDPTASDAPTSVPTAAGVDLVLDDVTVRRPGRTAPVLDGVTVRIPAGRLTVVAGPSGAGKSTLLDVLIGRVAPDTGRFRVGGQILGNAADPAWRAQVAWAPQRPSLTTATVGGAVRLTAPDASESAVATAMEASALDAFVRDLAEGCDTRVGPGARGLSGGERRRIGLARAHARRLARTTPLLIVDEPTADLDEDTARRVRAGLRMAGVTVVVASHDPVLAASADHLVVLDGGRVTHAGAPADRPEETERVP